MVEVKPDGHDLQEAWFEVSVNVPSAQVAHFLRHVPWTVSPVGLSLTFWVVRSKEAQLTPVVIIGYYYMPNGSSRAGVGWGGVGVSLFFFLILIYMYTGNNK